MFFCDYLGVPAIDKHNHSNTSFDRVFSYKKSNGGRFAAFIGSGNFMPAEEREPFLYGHVPAGEAGSHAVDWKVFDVYRFNRETKRLTRSVVSYIPREDYEKKIEENQNNPYAIPYSQEPLEFIEKEMPENYVKIGFDKSRWQCRELSPFNYFFRNLERGLFQIFSG